ncbi:unnamed protein product [Pipistrellus nathusii]|uniref:Uncharacterized protein n=1 Tax=Pipistrellus nathusii TaxID=59473 RepID=A0ABN9Z9H5_PIPNA
MLHSTPTRQPRAGVGAGGGGARLSGPPPPFPPMESSRLHRPHPRPCSHRIPSRSHCLHSERMLRMLAQETFGEQEGVSRLSDTRLPVNRPAVRTRPGCSPCVIGKRPDAC